MNQQPSTNNYQLKVCGLTKIDQIQELISLNVDFLGFIFYEKSPRYVLHHLSLKEIAEIPHFGKVGVFVNESIEKIAEITEKAKLNFIQLHGDEDENFIKDLRKNVKKEVKLIKVFRVGETFNFQFSIFNSLVDYFLFDTDSKAFGGTGKTFDWKILNEIEIPKYRDFYVGMDLGFKDFTFVVFCFYDFFNARIVVMDELCLSAELTSNIAIKIKEKESELFNGFEPLLRVSDNDIQQLYDLNVNFGLKFVPATKYDKEESINRLRGVFGDNKIIIHKRCINLIDQLLLGVYNNSRKDYERTPGLGHLDGIDALRYLIRKINYNKNPVPEHSGLSAYNNPIPFKKNKQKTAFMEILNGTK